MKVSDYIIKFLVDKGVKTVFIITGGAVMYITDSLNNYPIKYVCCHNEQALAMATEAYARVSEDIGVCIVTSGPGGTNAITGVMSAWIDSIPMLVISGQVATSQLMKTPEQRQRGIQEDNIIEIVKPMTKYAKLITDINTLPYEIDKAYNKAITGRPGPVWLDIPVDIQGANIEDINREYLPVTNKVIPDKSIIDELICKFIKAKKPLLYVGNGIRLGKAMDEFETLLKNIRCPIQTTWGAVDYLDYEDDRYAGHPGTWGQQWANKITQEGDFLLCLGTRLSFPQTGYYRDNWAKNAIKYVVDIDPIVLNEVESFGCKGILSDIKVLLKKLCCHLAHYNLNDLWQDWISECNNIRDSYPIVKPEYYNEKLNSYVFLEKLSMMVGANWTITSDVGTSFTGMFPVWRVKKGQRIINSSGLLSMGQALPSAIGAWFANPHHKILMLCGDGGFQMNIQELQTIKHHNIPVKMFVFCNDGYVTIKHTLDNHFKRLTAVDSEHGVSMPDFSKVAKAYRIRGYHIHEYDDMDIVPEILLLDEPCLVSVHTGPMQPIIPKLGAKIRDGKFQPVDFDDMII